MLSFDIRQTSGNATRVSGDLAPTDPVWQEGDPIPAGPLHVEGRLSPAGGARFYFSGRMQAPAEADCRRCLVGVRREVNEDIQAVFAAADTEDTSDPDVFAYDPTARELDLSPAIRELWLLAAPAFVECSEECKGLCPRCGQNLNSSTCDCPPARDARWDALRPPAASRR